MHGAEHLHVYSYVFAKIKTSKDVFVASAGQATVL